MPLIVDPGAFIAGGKRGVKVFEGVYGGFEDDLPNTYQEGKLRSRFIFTDVEIIESEAPVELQNNEFDFYINQSNSDRSANQFLVDDYEEFGASIGVEGPALVTLQGGRYRVEKKEYDFGGDFVSVVYIPTARAGETPVETTTTESPSGDDPLYDFVVDAVGEGSTLTTLSSALAKAPAAIRKAAIAAGGGKGYIQSLVDNGLLEENDGVLSAPAF